MREVEKMTLFVVLALDQQGDPVIVARTTTRAMAEAARRVLPQATGPYILKVKEMTDWWESMLPEDS